jgi:nucleoside 2-deoxyribosyltransferase
MKIYLAGSVPKGDKEQASSVDWRVGYEEKLKSAFPNASFINPYKKEVPESDFLYVFGKDCKEVKEADLIIVNSENRLGVGTSQEMVIAKYFNKKVVTVLPKDSYHRRSNVTFHGSLIEDWIHPFIFSFSDLIVESIEAVAENAIKIQELSTKGIGIIDEAITYASK